MGRATLWVDDLVLIEMQEGTVHVRFRSGDDEFCVRASRGLAVRASVGVLREAFKRPRKAKVLVMPVH